MPFVWAMGAQASWRGCRVGGRCGGGSCGHLRATLRRLTGALISGSCEIERDLFVSLRRRLTNILDGLAAIIDG